MSLIALILPTYWSVGPAVRRLGVNWLWSAGPHRKAGRPSSLLPKSPRRQANPRYPALTAAIKSPRPRGGGAGQYGLVLIILPDDQRFMVRRVVGVNEAGGKEGPRGEIFVSSHARGANAAILSTSSRPTAGRSGQSASGMFILMLCKPAEAVTPLRAARNHAPRRRGCGGWVVATRCQANRETGSLPPLGWEPIDQRAAGSRRLSSSSTTPAPLPQKLSLECVPRCRGGGESHGRCGYFQSTPPADEISIGHEPARATTCALLNIKLQQLLAGRQDYPTTKEG
jgi:hypothetical protein